MGIVRTQICNVGHGSKQIVEVTGNKYIVYDLGDDQQTLDDFVADCNEKFPNETPHVTLILSHNHSDHTGGLGDILEKHKNEDLKIDAVYMDLSILKSEALVKILQTDDKIEINDFSDNKDELKEILAYALLAGTDKKKINGLVKKFNEGQDKYNQLNIKDIEAFKKKEVERMAEEYREEKKEVLGESKKDEEAKRRINKLFDNIAKFHQNGVEVKPAPANTTIEIYGVNVEFYRLDKERLRSVLREAGVEGDIEEKLFLAAKGYRRYRELERDKMLGRDVDEELQDLENIMSQYVQDLQDYLRDRVTYGKKDTIKDPRTTAYALIKRAFGYEGNMGNVACRIYDDKKVFFLGGDMEMPLEIQIMMDGRKISCDVYVLAHHDSPSSNSVLFLAEMMLQSVKEGRYPIFVSTLSKADRNKYDKLNDKKFEMLDTVRMSTIGGTITFEVRDDTIYIKQKTMEDQINKIIYSIIKDQSEDFKTKESKVCELIKYVENGVPLEEFVKAKNIKVYQKMQELQEEQNDEYIR